MATIAAAPGALWAAEAADNGGFTEVGGTLTHLSRALAGVIEQAVTVISAAPRAFPDFIASLEPLAAPAAGSRPLTTQLGLIAAALLLCLAARTVFHVATRSLRRACYLDKSRPRASIELLALDAIDRAVVFVVAYALMAWLFGTGSLQDRLAVALLWASVRWWLHILILDTVLRPRHPELRLIHVSDRAAGTLRRYSATLLAIGIGTISIMPLLLSVGLPVPSAQFLGQLLGVDIAGGAAVGLLRVRRLQRAEGAVGQVGIVASRSSLLVTAGLALTAALWLVWSIAVLLLEFEVYHALVWSIGLVALAYAVNAAFALSIGEDAAAEKRAGPPPGPSGLTVTRRLVRVGGGLAIAFILTEKWLVGRLGVIAPSDWSQLRSSLIVAAFTVFIGYAAWELLHHWIGKKIAAVTPVVGPRGAAASGTEAAAASRLSTVLPMLRFLLGALIIIMTALVALSQVGVNIGPLIAGASILGLAISFGSQALVRDIVSGIFFMIDDAFRTGEYIDTGRLKGTVEKISLRSVQLRHQNGQVHTIPYGQLTSITNFSRDWATIKFNLRLSRDSDIEKVRKALKKVGQEMLEDPEVGHEFVEPLKLQGLADIADSALVCRVKFTAKPENSSWVQREALKRIHRAFKEKGIEFASNAVTVQTTSQAPPEPAVAAAAVAQARQPT